MMIISKTFMCQNISIRCNNIENRTRIFWWYFDERYWKSGGDDCRLENQVDFKQKTPNNSPLLLIMSENHHHHHHRHRHPQQQQKMLESRPEDALVKLVKTVYSRDCWVCIYCSASKKNNHDQSYHVTTKTQLRVWVHRYDERVWRWFWGERFPRHFPKGRGQEIQTEAWHWLHCLVSFLKIGTLVKKLFPGWTNQTQDPKTYTSVQRSFSTIPNQPQTTGRVQACRTKNDSKVTWENIVAKNLCRLEPMKLAWWQKAFYNHFLQCFY